MRKGLRRWLLQRRTSTLQPLYQRTSWYDFAGRMHRAIALDVALLLGEITLAEIRAQQKTRPLPAVEPNAPTERVPGYWWYADETIHVADSRIDVNATLPIPM